MLLPPDSLRSPDVVIFHHIPQDTDPSIAKTNINTSHRHIVRSAPWQIGKDTRGSTSMRRESTSTARNTQSVTIPSHPIPSRSRNGGRGSQTQVKQLQQRPNGAETLDTAWYPHSDDLEKLKFTWFREWSESPGLFSKWRANRRCNIFASVEANWWPRVGWTWLGAFETGALKKWPFVWFRDLTQITKATTNGLASTGRVQPQRTAVRASFEIRTHSHMASASTIKAKTDHLFAQTSKWASITYKRVTSSPDRKNVDRGLMWRPCI